MWELTLKIPAQREKGPLEKWLPVICYCDLSLHLICIIFN